MKHLVYLVSMNFFFVTNMWSQTQTCPQNQNDPNLETITQEIGTDIIEREYIIHIPENYNEDNPASLLFNLHGFGDCVSNYAETIGEFYNFRELGNEENIIVVYPQGAYRPEKEDTYWEPGDPGIENIYENDVYFIDRLIEKISAEYAVDSDKIFACGYSNGGMMSYSLACNRSTIFSAIGIMSGTMLEEDCDVDEAVPIIVFHGIDDGVLPYNGNFWYQSVAEVVNYWLDQNMIPESSLNSTTLEGGNVILDEYTGGDDNSCISLYTINEEFDKPGDHVWFSEEIEGLTPNEIMWDFFESNCGVISSVDLNEENGISFYPNPVQSVLRIKNGSGLEYTIYDNFGKSIQRGKLFSDQEQLDLGNLPDGLYQLKIGDNIEKLVKI